MTKQVTEHELQAEVDKLPTNLPPEKLAEEIGDIFSGKRSSAEQKKRMEHETAEWLGLMAKQVTEHDYVHPLDDPSRHIENWHEFYKSEEHQLWKQRMEQEIAEWLGFKPCHRLVEGYKIALAVHQRTANSKHFIIDKETGEKRESLIAVPDTAIEEDKWINPVGRVISMGAEAYMTGRWEDGTLRPRCKLGEYIHFPRHDGYMIKYRERPVIIMADDRIGGKVESPDYVSKY